MVLLFLATSDLHLKYKLKMSREEALAKAVSSVEYAKSHGLKVSMSTEDSTRSDVDFMLEVYRACEKAGASRLGITDFLCRLICTTTSVLGLRTLSPRSPLARRRSPRP
jgi:isopropylmalate/homocitrate/citramalate synthase